MLKMSSYFYNISNKPNVNHKLNVNHHTKICCKTKVNRTVYSCGLYNLLQNFVIELSKILRRMSLLSFDSLNQPLGFIALVVMKKDLYQPTITVTQDLLKFWSYEHWIDEFIGEK